MLNQQFVNNGTIQFLAPGPPPGFRIRSIQINDLEFVTTGQLPGQGKIIGSGLFNLTGQSSFINRTRPASEINLNSIVLFFTGAIAAGGGFVTLEAASNDAGVVVAGLRDYYALDVLCIKEGSKVRLTDLFRNQDGNEVVYARTFGLSANSTLDLNGSKLYYLRDDDPFCDGIRGTSLVVRSSKSVQKIPMEDQIRRADFLSPASRRATPRGDNRAGSKKRRKCTRSAFFPDTPKKINVDFSTAPRLVQPAIVDDELLAVLLKRRPWSTDLLFRSPSWQLGNDLVHILPDLAKARFSRKSEIHGQTGSSKMSLF